VNYVATDTEHQIRWEGNNELQTGKALKRGSTYLENKQKRKQIISNNQ
jgi:hypothetical protein